MIYPALRGSVNATEAPTADDVHMTLVVGAAAGIAVPLFAMLLFACVMWRRRANA